MKDSRLEGEEQVCDRIISSTVGKSKAMSFFTAAMSLCKWSLLIVLAIHAASRASFELNLLTNTSSQRQ